MFRPCASSRVRAAATSFVRYGRAPQRQFAHHGHHPVHPPSHHHHKSFFVASSGGAAARSSSPQERTPVPHTDDVRFETVHTGDRDVQVVTLNRPKALNALNLPMIRSMFPKYQDWFRDEKTSMIIIKGVGDKAFCAGGDIRAIYDAGRVSGADRSIMSDFFKEEYNLNYIIGCLEKPHIAILNGITMGGGVGLSVHGSVVIATENATFAMPETGIGFFPDVGGSFFLPRLQTRGREDRYYWPVNPLGNYLALTGARLKGPEIYLAGIATHYIESARLPELEKALTTTRFRNDGEIYDFIDSFNSPKIPLIWEDRTNQFAPLKAYLNAIMDNFGWASNTKYALEDRVRFLQREGTAPDWAKGILQALSKMSPTSLKVTQELMYRCEVSYPTTGGGKSLRECLEMEYRLSRHFMKGHDFFEGVRAALVDKDKNPKWQPSKLEEVTDEVVDAYFESTGDELELPEYVSGQ